MGDFNSKIKQVLLLMIILSLVYMIIGELFDLYTGAALVAFTLYILSRSNYFQLVYNRKWKKDRPLFYLCFLSFLLGLPVYLAITLISPKIEQFLGNPGQIVSTVKSSVTVIQNEPA